MATNNSNQNSMKYSPGIIGVLKHVFLFAFVCNVSMAQEQEVVLPSPETAALFRYQEYPMDYSTGLPQISIPLFNLKNGSLSVPISISYHASGFKVTDVDGPIATGWSLNIGGMVSRTIYGDPDFGDFAFPDAFNPYLNTPGQNTLQILEQVTHYPDNPNLVEPGEYKDSQYDIFSYSFGNHSGKFIFADSAGIKTPVELSNKPLLITPSTNQALIGLTITDDKGDNYTFVGQESQANRTLDYTGFALKKILSANQKDSIVYSYWGNSAKQYRRYTSQYETLNDQWEQGGDPYSGEPVTEVPNGNDYDIHRISEIDFGEGTLEFTLLGGTGQDSIMIDHIQLKDRNGKMMRKVKFKRDSLHIIEAALGTMNLLTHKLTGIEVQDQNGNVVENYVFDHYPTVYAAQDAARGGILDPRFIDYWGYYNVSGDTNMIPYYDNVSVQPNGGATEVGNPNTANRAPYLPALKSGVLKKIYYPTGGSTELVYEHNEYLSSETGLNADGPGLRVKEIINSDGKGTTVNRTFKYSTEANTFTNHGHIELEPKKEYMHTAYLYDSNPNHGTDHRERKFLSGFIPSLSELAYRPIRYTHVTEYTGSILDNVGRTDYEYDYFETPRQVLPNGDGGIYNKWYITQYRYWEVPKLISQTDYKAVRDGNGTITAYDEKRRVANIYSKIKLDTIDGLHVQRNYIFYQENKALTYEGAQNYIYVEEDIFNGGEPVYAYGPYSISVGTKNLASTTETLTNDDDSTVSTFTSYVYNANNLVSEVHTETSKTKGTSLENLVQKKEMTYPFDYPGIAVLDTMVVYNMLQHKVEEKDYLDGQLTNSSKINYKDWIGLGGVVILPDTLLNAKGNGALEPKVIFHGYDTQGNPEEIYKVNAPHTYYIWGYQQTMPIAKIDNFGDSRMTTAIQDKIDLAVIASDADIDRTIDTIDGNGLKNYIGEEGDLREALDNLRSELPADTQMSHFTYDPLIGATSMTDPRGYTIYYVYDAFNRLKEVRDADGNMVSDYDYSYKQPISN